MQAPAKSKTKVIARPFPDRSPQHIERADARVVKGYLSLIPNKGFVGAHYVRIVFAVFITGAVTTNDNVLAHGGILSFQIRHALTVG